ncbi:hypothetical protein [Kocuria sabuli]|uniref:hypothetical protein n=1 Tax=Kocuria sabuli TaxID=3071448 RepID=UPI0034D4BD02
MPRWARDNTTEPVRPMAARRAWDLRPGDHFHGRTIAAVHGVVGLASSPVAVISFTGPNTEQHSQARVAATRTDTDRGHDGLLPLARNWVRVHGLAEGQAVDLLRLKNDVLTTVTPECTSSTVR